MSAAVESRVYVDGVCVAKADSLEEACRQHAEHAGPARLSLIVLDHPTPADVHRVDEEFGMHPLAVEDALERHQRPKLDRYGQAALVVLRPARYLDEPEEVEVGEVHLWVAEDHVILMRHGCATHLDGLVAAVEAESWVLARGGAGVLYTILDAVVDGYGPVLAGLENDVDEIEDEVFAGEGKATRRIYELSREALALQRATHPLTDVVEKVESLVGSGDGEADQDDLAGDELRAGLADVEDHLTGYVERADALRTELQAILQTNAALVGIEQNTRMAELAEEQFQDSQQTKRISSWAAIAIVPTIIGSVYGMNFAFMPELSWRYGYPFALGLMVAACTGLYWRFKRIGWL